MTGWRIATLPIRFGGLQSVSDISEVAYLASMHATKGLVKNILSNFSEFLFDNSLAVRVQSWNKRNFALSKTKSSQLQWDQINFKIVSEKLKTSLDQHRLACFLATSQPHTGAWLTALPASSLGNLLSNDCLRYAVALVLVLTCFKISLVAVVKRLISLGCILFHVLKAEVVILVIVL